MLTKEKLEKMKINQIIKEWVWYIEICWATKLINFTAVRLFKSNYSIYFSKKYEWKMVQKYWEKLYNEDKIKEFLPCDKESFNLYLY